LKVEQQQPQRMTTVETRVMDSQQQQRISIAPWLMAKRSVVIAGHKTSVSLENAFWDALKAAAARRGITINELVTLVDGARHGNLSSALRVFLLNDSRGDVPLPIERLRQREPVAARS
jgi:predicted DNA-binding ribbon-helix-helix protein